MFAEWREATRGHLSGWRARNGRRTGIRVFLYHGVVERKTDPLLQRNEHLLSVFVSHVEYLRRFRILGVDELLEAIQTGKPSKRPMAMVTFDDGFANNLRAAEVLSRRRIPWCLFVAVGELGPSRAMWPVELSLLLLRGCAQRVEALGRSWSLGSRSEREGAFGELRRKLKTVPAPLRRDTLAGLRQQFPAGESERLLAEFPSLRMMSVDELRQLAATGVEIGSHGSHHEIHHADQPEGVRRFELSSSKAELEQLLGRPCRTFAFPNGDFVPESPREVEQAGYRAAFTTEQAALDPRSADPFLLPRIEARGSLQGLVRSYWWREASDQPAPRENPTS